jgi:hypothetical protein
MTLGPTGGKTGSTTRRGRGFRSPAETARRRLGEAAAGHGFAEPEVLLRWSEVVGEQLSALCAPVKVNYSQNHGLGATLVVRTEGARAPEVEHLGPRIIERVNQFYGYRAIARLKVTQEEPARFAGRPNTAPAEPGANETARAADLTRGIQNDALRTALTRMGAHVLANADAPEES